MSRALRSLLAPVSLDEPALVQGWPPELREQVVCAGTAARYPQAATSDGPSFDASDHSGPSKGR